MDLQDARPQSAEGTGEEALARGDEGKGRGAAADSYDELFENFSPVNSPDHLFDLSDEELGSTKRVSCQKCMEGTWGTKDRREGGRGGGRVEHLPAG